MLSWLPYSFKIGSREELRLSCALNHGRILPKSNFHGFIQPFVYYQSHVHPCLLRPLSTHSSYVRDQSTVPVRPDCTKSGQAAAGKSGLGNPGRRNRITNWSRSAGASAARLGYLYTADGVPTGGLKLDGWMDGWIRDRCWTPA